MTWYVPNGNKSERCRAKDPAHCWYHVGKDGKVLQHYPSLEACRKAIEDEAKRRNTGNKRSLSKAGQWDEWYEPGGHAQGHNGRKWP